MAGQGLLSEYNAKRDFHKTVEPRGKAARRAGHLFVIQKHRRPVSIMISALSSMAS
jgi:bifunctional non-homologous end joining protein LigD